MTHLQQDRYFKNSRATKRSTRLKDIEEYLLTRRQPVSVKAIAGYFQVHRATIYRSLSDLETEWEVPIMREGGGRVWIDRQHYLTDVRLNLNEATTVFIAARLLARYSDKPNPHAVRALNKLSIALAHVAPHMARHIAQTSDHLDRGLNESQQEYLGCLEALTQAWADGVRAAIVQREAPDVERLFEPYFIEPSAVGYSTYVIGYDHHRRDIRTFKVERLLRVRLTADAYAIPAGFDPYTLLAGAWGVNWGAGGQPTDVVLRFAAGRAAQRVRETNWHETQRIEDLPDGGCILNIQVGSTQEMKPWIRQWGCDCEVLAPAELRAEIGEEMKQAGELYTDSD
ncbi:MAG: WYL domain-containing protein [Chloroflexi bacterium]|nr:WYL domain-containing protein [Chloroflexota bacterium]